MGRIVVKKLPRGETTEQGAYYAQVDGRNVGMPDRPFWRTHEQAKACGIVCLADLEDRESANA